MRTSIPVLLVAALSLLGCGEGDSPTAPAQALFRVEACGDVFHVLMRNPQSIRTAQEMIGASDQKILTGILRRGDGGFNAPWSWHLDPSRTGFADVTIELCDGCPDHIENDLDYWIDTVGQYCPWTTRVVSRVW